MKKVAMVVAMFLIATMSLGGVTAFAAETPRDGGAFGVMWNAEDREWAGPTDETKAAMLEGIKASLAGKLEAGEITQEAYDAAIARLESGNFPFIGKGFKGMACKKPENMGNFKPEMPAFDGKSFKDILGKKPENMGNFKPEMPAFDGKSFKDMLGKKPENLGSFKPEMPAFDGENFKNLGGKPGERPKLTDEQKAALMENIKSSLGDNFPAGRLMPIKNAVPGMFGGATKPVAATEGQ